MKKLFVLVFLMVNVTHIICQNTDKTQENFQSVPEDSVVVASGPGIIYPLTSDKIIKSWNLIKRLKNAIYPLLILNDIIIREEEKVNCFRNHFDRTKIKKIKCISKAEAEKKGIPNVPKDGVLFVTTKKGYYFDFSCE